MGWTFTHGETKKSLIQDRCKGWHTQAAKGISLAKCVRGNILWIVWEVTRKDTDQVGRFIECDILGSDGAFGWGYKDMEESMGPCYYSCPIKFLDMVQEDGTGNTSEKWREEVRKHAAQVNRKVKVGEMFKLSDGRVLTVLTVRPLRVSVNGFGTFRCSRRILTTPHQVLCVKDVIGSSCPECNENHTRA